MPSLKPPSSLSAHRLAHHRLIFLAGSIDNGAAVDWQRSVEDHFAELPDYLLLNPRRDDWDATWKQEMADPQFAEQVNWELDGLDAADRIILYFAPGSRSPISLLELGLYAGTGKVLVCCPPGFWRRGNVEIVADRYRLPFFDDLGELLRTHFAN